MEAAIKLIQEQAQIAQDITSDFDKFKARLETEGTCTRSVYNVAKEYLEDAFGRFKKNHAKLEKALNPEHEYFMQQKFEATEYVVTAFKELLDLPLKNPNLYKPATIVTKETKAAKHSETVPNTDEEDKLNDDLGDPNNEDNLSQHSSFRFSEADPGAQLQAEISNK